MESPTRTVIFCHGNCPDGFGGAYAAWKKFGDSAEYIPLHHNRPAPLHIQNANLYFIDFCYPKEIMDQFVANNVSVVVLDHHEGVKEVVRSMPEYVYDETRSGATVAWTYFHPNTPVPSLLSYIEDGDLYRFELPNAQAILTYVYAQLYTFERWNELATLLETEDGRKNILATGSAYFEYKQILMKQIAGSAEKVMFEGMEVMLTSAPRMFISDVGHELYEEFPPMALVTNTRPDGVRVSMRGNGTLDLSVIAQKYGGNGHPNSAAFSLPWGAPIPWTPMPKEV